MRMVHQQPAGRLRVDASAPVMLHCVVPHVAEFRRAYPQITLELTSNDRIVDLMEHRSDVALRAGPLTDSTLHARPLRPAPRWLLASPDYIARRGEPKDVDELLQHELLGFTQPESLNVWPLRRGAAPASPSPPRWPPPAARLSTSWRCAAWASPACPTSWCATSWPTAGW